MRDRDRHLHSTTAFNIWPNGWRSRQAWYPHQIDYKARAIIITPPGADSCPKNRVGNSGQGRPIALLLQHRGRDAERHNVLRGHEPKDSVRCQNQVLLPRMTCYGSNLRKPRHHMDLRRTRGLCPVVAKCSRRCKPSRCPRQGDSLVRRERASSADDPLDLLRARTLNVVVTRQVPRRASLLGQDAPTVATMCVGDTATADTQAPEAQRGKLASRCRVSVRMKASSNACPSLPEGKCGERATCGGKFRRMKDAATSPNSPWPSATPYSPTCWTERTPKAPQRSSTTKYESCCLIFLLCCLFWNCATPQVGKSSQDT